MNVQPNTQPEAPRFCPVSLGDWMEVCRQAGLQHVPALRVTEIRKEDYLLFDRPGEHRDRLGEAWKAINAARLDNRMMRLDCGSSADIKRRTAQGESG